MWTHAKGPYTSWGETVKVYTATRVTWHPLLHRHSRSWSRNQHLLNSESKQFPTENSIPSQSIEDEGRIQTFSNVHNLSNFLPFSLSQKLLKFVLHSVESKKWSLESKKQKVQHWVGVPGEMSDEGAGWSFAPDPDLSLGWGAGGKGIKERLKWIGNLGCI